MTSLFPRLYLDEDVDILLADLLQAHGFQAITTVASGQRAAPDAAQLARAAANACVLFTHNRADFEALARQYYAADIPHSGIIIAIRRPIYELARRTLILLNSHTATELHDQVRYV